MRGVAVASVALFCLAGCQSGGPDLAVATPAPTAIPAVALSQPEPRDEQKLNQPPAPRAKDQARPEDPLLARKPEGQARPTAAVSARLPEPDYPVHRPAPTARFPQPSSGHPGFSSAPAAVAADPQSLPSVPPEPPSTGPSPYSSPTYLPPALPRPALPRPAPPTPNALPARPQPVAIGQPPRLPGQAAPPPFTTPLGERRAREKQLEEAYLQSRADALNLKYHAGRPVLSKYSPTVMNSATAPPPVTLPPSIPGTYGVVDALKASEVKRQEWQSYRNQLPGGAPSLPQPPGPAIPQPPAPGPTFP